MTMGRLAAFAGGAAMILGLSAWSALHGPADARYRTAPAFVGAGKVRFLVNVWKLAYRTFNVTVRPASPSARSVRATSSASTPMVRARNSRSAVSCSKVVSRPIDFVCREVWTGRSSSPRLRRVRDSAANPSDARRRDAGVR